jgi:hypothetical protein
MEAAITVCENAGWRHRPASGPAVSRCETLNSVIAWRFFSLPDRIDWLPIQDAGLASVARRVDARG